MRSWHARLGMLLLLLHVGGCSMGLKARRVVLSWQSPVGRTAAFRVAAKVSKIGKPSVGFLGLLRSPSIAGPASLPDPIELSAAVVSAPADFGAEAVELTAPRAYLPALSAGDHVALGILANAVCVCIEKIPPDVATQGDAAIEHWIADWTACSGS